MDDLRLTMYIISMNTSKVIREDLPQPNFNILTRYLQNVAMEVKESVAHKTR
jgi:hypothetical protein